MKMRIKYNRLLCLLFCFALAFTATACGKTEEKSLYKPGTYSAKADGKNGAVEVEVEFSKSKIEFVTVKSHHETEGFSDEAISKIPERIIANQSLAIDAVSGATLSSNAILKAVEDCVVQAGGDLGTLKAGETATNVKKTEAMEYDIVVVGAGAAGTAAALAASEQNQNVLLLEKNSRPMGAGTLAGGLFAAESDLQKKAGKTVSKEWLYNEYLKSSSGYMNPLLVRTIIDESSETVNWLIANGCELNLVDAGAGGSNSHVDMPATLHGYAEGGTVAITKLIESFTKNGGTVLYSTPAKSLIKSADGTIAGVIAEKEDGTELKITAKAVVLATGGFGGNGDMLEEYIGQNYTYGEISSNMGDGIQMAWEVGADKFGQGATQYFWQTFDSEVMKELVGAVGNDWFQLTSFTFYPHLRVNTFGQRFSDETTASVFALHGAQIHMQPGQSEFIILDEQVLNQITQKGYVSVEDHYGKWKNNRQFFMEFNEPNDTDTLIAEENTPTDYRPLLDQAVGTGAVYKGNTLDELAANMGVNPATFKASVQQYNEAISTGNDDLFFSNTEKLIPVVKGPYYAVKYSARNLTTLGGVRINEKIQAVDHNYLPIPGLYVTGADAGGMYAMSYVDIEGGTLGFAYTSGRLAGKHAAESNR